ncbi:MAG: SLC13 family permease [Vicinamibacterales bacterium]
MSEVVAYSTAAVTLGLVAARPRIGVAFRITPAMAALAGVSFMSAAGIVRAEHLAAAVANLWSPFVAIASIMVMTEVARRAGVLEWWASLIETRAPSTSRLFLLVFALGVVSAAAFNNDAAILLLTPVVVSLAERRYPGRPEMVLPFAFAVLMSAGVAALPVSNPMNMVVATFLGIPLGEYILHMLPLAVTGWFIAFLVLKQILDRASCPWARWPGCCGLRCCGARALRSASRASSRWEHSSPRRQLPYRWRSCRSIDP